MSAPLLYAGVDAVVARELPAAASGDRDAYGRIVVACQNMVTAIALAITRDVPSSEDIAQEAFLKAWQHLERLQSPDSFLPWLRQIARNLARDHLRAQGQRPLDGVNAELALAVAADPGPQPEQQLLQSEYEATATELIAALPDDSREALLLFYREGQSSQQVANLLGLSDAAVRKRLSRVRQQLRDDMLARFGEFARSSAPSAAFAVAVVAALGGASKPAMAATLSGAAAATLGKTASGGAVGMFGSGLAGGLVALYLVRRYLLGFAETLEERAAIQRWSMQQLGLALIVAITVMGGDYLLAGGKWPWETGDWFRASVMALIGFQITNYHFLVPLSRIMTPMLERDARRRPKGAKRRLWMYKLNFGMPAVIMTNLMMLGLSIGLYHYDGETPVGACKVKAPTAVAAGRG